MPQRPYGNDFIVETPSLDRAEQRLYAEQKQKEAQQQYNIKQLDDEFSKNVSNIRDADVDDFTNLYNDYKLATQSSIKNKSGTSPQQQMELLRKRANMYKLINESKAEREREEMYGKRYSTKPDDFNDNAPELLIEGRKLPISKKRNYIGADGVAIDLTNPQNLLWQDKTNWQPILQKAGGTLNRRGESTRVKLPGGLEEEETTYKGLSSPVDYYQSIVGAAMSSPRGAKSLSNRYQFTPEEAQDITIKFEALKNTPEFKAAYGDVKFPEFADMTEGTRTAKLLAMTHALNNPIVAEKKNIKNLDAVMNRAQELKLKYAAVQNAYIKGRQKLTQQSEGLSKYDVLGLYYDKATPAKRNVKVGGGGVFPKYEEVEEYRIPANEVDANHKKLFGNVAPYSDDEGNKYYVVRDDGDWEGKGGQLISRTSVATEKQNKTSISEEKRGVPDMNRKPDAPKKKVYQGLDKNGNPIYK